MSKNLFLLLGKSSLLLLPLVLISCRHETPTANSFVIVAVDNLTTADLNCSREIKKEPRPLSPLLSAPSAIDLICQDAVNFSHVYTTSTLSQPALSSILTGQYPHAMGVHNNSQFLSPSYETIIERAYAHGLDTSLFSGGAPILRKSGLAQGFALFDDNLKPSPQIVFRPFKASIALFRNRLKEINRENFFSLLYVPDLQFVNQPTKNKLGESRNLSFESQWEEFDEGLSELIALLKEEKKWDKTHLIIVGLKGRPGEARKNIPFQSNLHSETTQVGLIWKPAKNFPVQTHLINESLSLADLGTTLFSLLDGQPLMSEVADFPTLSFESLMLQESLPKNSKIYQDRWLPIESAWHSWREQNSTLHAIRKAHFLCLIGPRNACYNTLIDKEELNNLFAEDKFDDSIRTLRDELSSIIKNNHLESSQTTQLKSPAPPTSSGLANQYCLKQISGSKIENLGNIKCDDPLTQELLAWLVAEQNPSLDSNKRESIKKRFLRSLYYRNADRFIAAQQLAMGLIWDVPSALMINPDLLDQVFALPDFQKIKAQVNRALNQVKEEN